MRGITAILLGALAFTGCGTFRNKYDGSGEFLVAMERDLTAKSAEDALNEMGKELRKMADDGDIFEPGIQAKIPSIGILRPSGENLAS
ncbi:MAG: hypothetical protein LBI91_00190, partial [Spirochaetaceae bacterium]|nr:hypothetical protein [Spirochaetaceae bacterium]